MTVTLSQRIRIAIIVVSMAFACSCGGMSTNHNLPSYVKTVTAYKEGPDGIVVYFVLADAQGSMTTADGAVHIQVNEKMSDGYESNILDVTYPVRASEFVRTKVGMGAFEREVLLFPIGRVTYSQFKRIPNDERGVIHLTFLPAAGGALKGEDETIFF
jgi:hypothetical protein